MLEQRFSKTIEVRAESGGILTGRALSYGKYSTDRALGYRENFAPRSLATSVQRCSSGKCKHFATRNHNPDNLLARCGNGSLQLQDTPTGLNFRMQLDMGNTIHADTWRSVQSGLLRGCSFAFGCNKDEWGEDEFGNEDDSDFDGGLEGRCAVRTVTDADLYSVDVVTSPAYGGDATSVQARAAAMFPQGLPVEVRSHCPALADLLKLSRYVGVSDGHRRAYAAKKMQDRIL